MGEFKKYRRTNIAEMRSLTTKEKDELLLDGVSVSNEDDLLPEDEFIKGKVARNPQNHTDQWYVAMEYFENNFEEA